MPDSRLARARSAYVVSRRGFFGRMFGAIATAVAAPFVAKKAQNQTLTFRSDTVTHGGISMRYVKDWDIHTNQTPRRFDYEIIEAKCVDRL